MIVYKILPLADWRKAGAVVPWSDDDRRDGFMHLSKPDQVSATLRRHFTGKSGLVAAAIDAAKIVDLRYESSRGGELFPHCYGEIPRSAVVGVRAIALRDGEPALGDDL